MSVGTSAQGPHRERAHAGAGYAGSEDDGSGTEETGLS